MQSSTCRATASRALLVASLLLVLVPGSAQSSRWRILEQVGKRGSAPGAFNIPYAVSQTPTGDVVVADTGNSRLQVFSAQGQWKRSLGGHGLGPGRLRFPMGVSVDGSGTVAFVADTHNNRIVQLRMSDGAGLGSPLTEMGTIHQTPTPPFNRPRGVTWGLIQDPVVVWARQQIRCLVVVDTGNNRVGFFKLTGVESYENAGSLSMGYELLWWRDGTESAGSQVSGCVCLLLGCACRCVCELTPSIPCPPTRSFASPWRLRCIRTGFT